MSNTLNTTQVINLCQKNGVSIDDKILKLIDDVETEVFKNVRAGMKEAFAQFMNKYPESISSFEREQILKAFD